MSPTAMIERRCARVGRALEARSYDELELLRTARLLKRVCTDLRQAVYEHSKHAGWTCEITTAMGAIDDIDADLRSVLVDYPSLEPWQLREHLLHALDKSSLAREALQYP